MDAMNTNTNPGSIRTIVRSARGEFRARREARAALKALEQELASYSTPREVNDLLTLIENEEGVEAEQIRDILSENLVRTAAMPQAA